MITIPGPQHTFTHDGAEFHVYADEVPDAVRGGMIKGVIACTASRTSPPPLKRVWVADSEHFLVAADSVMEGAKAVEDGIRTGRLTLET